MRLIGTLPTESDATRFGNFLLAVGMPNHVEAGRDGAWQVWVEHDDHLEQATSQLHAYIAVPNDPKYAEASSVADRLRRDAAADAERRRRKHVDVRTSWSGLRTRPTPVAFSLIAICLVVGVLTRFSMGNEETARVVDALLFQPISALLHRADDVEALRASVGHGNPMTMFSSILRGEVWRLVSPIFLHGDLLHLIFNLSWLVALGRLIEARKGSIFLILLVLGTAVFSNCAQALWGVYGPVSKGDLAGALGYTAFGGFSGVNYALFGYAWIKGRFQPYEHIGVNQQTVGLMLAWLVLCILHVIPNVANAAHVAGLAAGVAVGYAPTLRRRIKAR